ncbi:hypothetical protein BcepSauron_354 [Burkholderia phage BcepSauron]|uniref:Uncharacterized protein n=2 Tax=Sarumanvirus TaxID=2843450 RepID=A0A482MLW4_9CAUD|nr:hypothetical protein H1O16_gp351 [Burkholderia phage BcepSaruman]YP_009904732.1 hypothetical protein H1O17_gp354 [Burkholderia phage BcepSauron]QBQ74734.1 hypothetical protein BcepSauron_354 [Burkholderia phage BcepSauron]QBX06764.1 hypothetical protein BcepSaruman_351 [Burkholderia phage BcepSaruman]
MINLTQHEKNLIARLRDCRQELSPADRHGLLDLIDELLEADEHGPE